MESPLRAQEKLLLIEKIPLFGRLSQADKKIIAASSLIVEYKQGEVIYRQSDPPDALYCVITGRLRVYIETNGRQVDLEYVKRGKYFGIISVLTGEPHSVTVQAVNDSIVLKFPKAELDKALKRIPEIAIHFSQTLSRRLKTKDLGEKRVFESTILSVFGTYFQSDITGYVVNLAISLRAQTGKEVILTDIHGARDGLSELLNIPPAEKILRLNTPFFDESVIKTGISRHDLGIDILHIDQAQAQTKNIISLLSYLTRDYHYVIVNLAGQVDAFAFELLKQSDMIHLITAADTESLCRTANMIAELESASTDIGRKIRLITSEHSPARSVPFADRRAILRYDIFATLPEVCAAVREDKAARVPVVVRDPGCEYSRMLRRISRRIGDCVIGLALGSGAALGLAHIGILKIIEKEDIPIDILAGTSMGALIGALWASGKSALEIEDVLCRFRSKIRSLMLLDITLPKRGLIKGREVRKFLLSQFHDKTFYDLKMPLKVVACDIQTRNLVVLEEGSVVDAVMASVAIPGVFEPVTINGKLLVDGGIIDPLPTDVLIRAGAAKIIAVNALPSPEDIQKSKKKVANIFDIIVNSVQASEYLLAETACQDADVAMHPILSTADWYEFYEGEKIVKKGEEEALKFLPQLKELINAR